MKIHFTKIFNIEKKKDKNNHIYTLFKNKRNFDYVKKKIKVNLIFQ